VKHEDYSVEERQWEIEYRLELLREFEYCILNGLNAKKNRELFSIQLHELFDLTEIEGEEKIEYTECVLSYLKGRTELIDLVDLFDYYIWR
jgi:hypothetical protein